MCTLNIHPTPPQLLTAGLLKQLPGLSLSRCKTLDLEGRERAGGRYNGQLPIHSSPTSHLEDAFVSITP